MIASTIEATTTASESLVRCAIVSTRGGAETAPSDTPVVPSPRWSVFREGFERILRCAGVNDCVLAGARLAAS